MAEYYPLPKHHTNHMGHRATHDVIVAFYLGEHADTRGRKIEEIWQWDDVRFETVHDYIQWLFPSQTRSQYNPNAPVLTEETIGAFRQSTPLRLRLRRSLRLVLRFYGLRLLESANGMVQVQRSPDFPTKARHWLTIGNHNHLRLTRIIDSTKTLGLEAYSIALFRCLAGIRRDYPQAISCETYRYWRAAIHGINSRSF